MSIIECLMSASFTDLLPQLPLQVLQATAMDRIMIQQVANPSAKALVAIMWPFKF